MIRSSRDLKVRGVLCALRFVRVVDFSMSHGRRDEYCAWVAVVSDAYRCLRRCRPESGSIPLRNWIFLLIPSPIPELELALPSPGGIELELPSLELESELRSSELNSELPSWN